MISLFEYCKKNNKEHLLKEWDYSKNQGLEVKSIAYGSNKKVWWVCPKCKYSWQAKVGNRVFLSRGCPCCSNRVIVPGVNDLATTHPNISKEWHPTKNGELTPQKVSHGSGKKVWWICPEGHEYQSVILHRTQGSGTGCPICYSGRQTSFAEQAVYYYIKKLFPDAINRFTASYLGKMELDIYIPSIKCGIEYDGIAWHEKRNKKDLDLKKYNICKSKGIKLIRLRESKEAPITKMADKYFYSEKLYEYPILESIIKKLISFLKNEQTSINVNIEKDRQKILHYKTMIKSNSLSEKCPEISKEWHPTKNGNLTPDMFNPGSDHKVWWLCPVCGNEYMSTIGHRTSKTNPTSCPKCGIVKSALSKSKQVNMIEPRTGKILKTFKSIADASKSMSVNHSNISSVCKGQRRVAGGYKWSYTNKND